MIFRQIKLDSIKELRKEVVNQCDDELHRLIKDSCLVGVVSKNVIAIQHDTKIILTDIQQLTYHLFYQIYLQDFGNFAMLEFDEPHNVETLYEMFETQRSQEPLDADSVRTKLTREHIRNMIDDYFSLEINEEGQICTLPVLLNGYHPNPYNLPRFINDLVHRVDWKSEKPCFQTFGQSLAKLYQASYLDYENHDDWVKTVTSILYPKIKSYLKPSEDLNNVFAVITTTNELYKVFERC
jgi:DNA mismatch repair protein MLH1